MKKFISKIKVRYAETDQMGVVHHGNYAQYLEYARIEWLDALGLPYHEIEKQGMMLPVFSMDFKFKNPAKFGDILTIETFLLEKPGVRISFKYNIYNQENLLLTEAQTTLVFMNAKTRKPIRCPQYFSEKLGF